MQWYVFKKEADIEGYYLLFGWIDKNQGIGKLVRFAEPYALDEPVWGLDTGRVKEMEPIDEDEVMSMIDEPYQQEFFRWVFKADLSADQ